MTNFLNKIKKIIFGSSYKDFKDYKVFAKELGEEYNKLNQQGVNPRDSISLAVIKMMNDAGGFISNGMFSPKGSPLTSDDIHRHCLRTFGSMYEDISTNRKKADVIICLRIMTNLYFYDFDVYAPQDGEIKDILNSVIVDLS